MAIRGGLVANPALIRTLIKSFGHSPLSPVSQASRLWLALAALVLLVFFCLSSSVFNRSPSSSQQYNLHQTASSDNLGTGPSLVGQRMTTLGRVHSPLAVPPHSHNTRHLPHHHAAQAAARTKYSNDVIGEEQQGEQEQWDEEETDDGDLEYAEEEEESHSDGEYLTEAHLENLHSEDVDEGKQHPDEPEYIDIWVSVKSKLCLSRASVAV